MRTSRAGSPSSAPVASAARRGAAATSASSSARATVNTIITFGVIIVAGAVAMIATSPDIPTVQIVVGLVIAAVVIPVLIYPVTYTLWQALDLAMRPPEPGDLPSPPVM